MNDKLSGKIMAVFAALRAYMYAHRKLKYLAAQHELGNR